MLITAQSAPILDVFGIDEGFRMFAEAGFGGIELNIDQELPGHKISAGEMTEFYLQSDDEIRAACEPYKAASEKYGVKIAQIHAPFPNRAKDKEWFTEQLIEAQKKTIMLSAYLNCPSVVVHPSTLVPLTSEGMQEEWDYNIRFYSALIPTLKQYGVICCLENMFSARRGKIMQAICSDPAEANRYVDTLNEIAGENVFGYCFDVGHALLLGHDAGMVARELGHRITSLHLHDNNGLSDQHLFPYMGILNWDSLCSALHDIGYTGNIGFETFNAFNVFDRALTPQLLNLLYATGELFRSRI